MATKLSFEAQIDEWVRESEARMLAVFRESTQRTISIAQSIVPVDTGFLRASVRASLEEMPQFSASGEGSPVDVVLVIAGAELGKTIYVGYTANYAAYVEYGTSTNRPHPYVGIAAAQWEQTVNKVIEDLKGRIQ